MTVYIVSGMANGGIFLLLIGFLLLSVCFFVACGLCLCKGNAEMNLRETADFIKVSDHLMSL